jgi:tetratricopeptide (TPR) repeat protein
LENSLPKTRVFPNFPQRHFIGLTCLPDKFISNSTSKYDYFSHDVVQGSSYSNSARSALVSVASIRFDYSRVWQMEKRPFSSHQAFEMSAAIDLDPVELFLGSSSFSSAASPEERGDKVQSRSIDGLRELAKIFSWGAVLELATSLLADHEDALEETSSVVSAEVPIFSRSSRLLLPHERLICEAFRGLALVQTRMVDRAGAHISVLGSLSPANIKYRYESYPEAYPDRSSDSFIPFELAAIAIEIRIRHGDTTAIADCYDLRKRYPEHETIILSALVGYHLRAQQFDASTDVARELALRQGATSRALYVYIRVLLHVGDFDEAERIFSLADAMGDSVVELRHVHKALLLASRGKYEAALAENEAAQSIVDCDKHVRMYAQANASICLLQMGRLTEAISRLETCLKEDPETSLDEGLVFNLCTMYDLAFPDDATSKKKVLHQLATRFGRQGFNLESISA